MGFAVTGVAHVVSWCSCLGAPTAPHRTGAREPLKLPLNGGPAVADSCFVSLRETSDRGQV